MTCLTTADVIGIPGGWEEYDRRILDVLGVDMITLAARAEGYSPQEVRDGLTGRKLAAVSISSGVGVVGGFAESLAAIGRHMGLEARVMSSPDGDGFKEAEDWGADFVISADDHNFVARETSRGLAADNNPATSQVFATALELMNGGSLRDQEVLVLGLGIIGFGAAVRLAEMGAYPLMYDPDPNRASAARAKIADGDVLVKPAELAEALKRTHLIYDATPVPEALPTALWPVRAVVAAPGVPLAWPANWISSRGPQRLWHDPLQSGTAAMLAKLACAPLTS